MTHTKKQGAKSTKQDNGKLFISVMAGFMVLCMLIPMVSMIVTAGLG